MKGFTVLFILIFFLSCSDKPSPPADLINKDNMGKILWDMVQADRFSTVYLLKDSAKKDVKAETFKLYDQVFQIHKVTKDQFVKSYKYYLSRPDIGKEIFDSVVVRANRARVDTTKPSQAP